MHNYEPKGYECELCIFASGNETDKNKFSDIVYDDDAVLAYICPKWWKNNPGNVMVIPKEHVENIYDISDDLLCKVQVLGKKVAHAIKEKYECDGVSFRQHNEPAGGQNVWHFHLHVFPRWEGDDLYLNHENTRPTTSDERAPYAQKLRTYFDDV